MKSINTLISKVGEVHFPPDFPGFFEATPLPRPQKLYGIPHWLGPSAPVPSSDALSLRSRSRPISSQQACRLIPTRWPCPAFTTWLFRPGRLAHWLEHWPIQLMVAGLIPGQVPTRSGVQSSGWSMHGRQQIDTSLSFSLPLSLKSLKHILRWGFF